MKKYVIGLDYGSDSVRSLIVDVETGEEVATAVYEYERWKAGKYCDPSTNQFRQHPLDYLEGLKVTIHKALEQAPAETAENVVGISIDTTGSTPVAVDEAGTPLALKEAFAENPNAMFVLWKDHTAIREADEINTLARTWGGEDFTRFSGGIYSSEWFWAKVLHILREDKAVRNAAFSWVEHCDWMPAVLTGTTHPLTMKRDRCAAGHKAMWNKAFDGLPSDDFLTRLDPLLTGLRDRLYTDTYTADTPVGTLTADWAETLGLSTNTVVGVGAFDAHLGAVGGQIKPYTLCKIMGTSTCDMLIAPTEEMGDNLIRGICGQVNGSIVPGMLGLEAGQSGFGDVYAWFKNLIAWPITALGEDLPETAKTKLLDTILPALEDQAAALEIGESGITALDWINGRRTPDANQALKGALTGLSMGTDAPAVFRALVEATAFGSKAIMDRFIDEGVKIEDVVALGGIAKKSSFVMQTTADIMNVPIKVVRSEQACALGAAMCAAVAAGVYETVAQAQDAMGGGFETEYTPIPKNAEKYQTLYNKYVTLGTFIEQQTE